MTSGKKLEEMARQVINIGLQWALMKKTLKAYAQYLVQCLIKIVILNKLVSQITMNMMKHVIWKLCSPERFPHLLWIIPILDKMSLNKF